MTTTAAATPFREAPRVLGLTGRVEKRALVWMAARVPAAVTPDHLTLLGLVATLACGVAYAFAGSQAWLLLVVNAGLVLNWLGDSLDGTLARHRRHERPRFGFYVDHLVDAFGALFLVGGLAVSGLMTPLVGAALLVAYFLLGIQTYLAAYTIGRFKISWGGLGGTELRYNLTHAFQLAAFLDVGNVYSEVPDITLGELRRSAGVGVRYRTPVGPVRLDWGYVLDRRSGEHRSKLHLTIGHAF